MRSELLAWAQTNASGSPRGTSYFCRELADAEKVVELFAYAHLSLARITREGWKFLWWNYGLDGLLEINRYAGWFDVEDDERAAADLVRESLVAGYDPVSGQYGEFSVESQSFELLACD
jgi:hypothetical protein